MGGKFSRDKGARYERALVAWLATHIWPHVERRGGGRDGDDIVGTLGWAIEAKHQETISLPAWFRQTESQARDDETPLLVIKRKGVADVGESYAVLRLSDLAAIINDDQ